MKKNTVFALTLIVTGALVLLSQLNVLHLRRPVWVMLGCAVSGVFLLLRSRKSMHRKGLLGGSFFLLAAFGIMMMENGLIPISDKTGFGMILIALGLANIIYFIFTRFRFSGLVFGLMYAGAGSLLFISYYDYLDWWSVSGFIGLYWPVLLILFGAALLIDGLRRQKNKCDDPGQNTVSGKEAGA